MGTYAESRLASPTRATETATHLLLPVDNAYLVESVDLGLQIGRACDVIEEGLHAAQNTRGSMPRGANSHEVERTLSPPCTQKTRSSMIALSDK